MASRMEILSSLEPMFKEADEKGLWFFCQYQSMWLSPNELKEWHQKGKFIWGEPNWQLKNPIELIAELEEEIKNKQKRILEIKERISQDTK